MEKSVVVYGPQGCGKTTNAKKLAEHFGLSGIADGVSAEVALKTSTEGHLILMTPASAADFVRLQNRFGIRRVLPFEEAMAHARAPKAPIEKALAAVSDGACEHRFVKPPYDSAQQGEPRVICADCGVDVPQLSALPGGKVTQVQTDNVNRPSHYTTGKVECIDALEAATEGLSGLEAVCTANAIKYLWRWKKKNGQEDLRKARWYINKLLGDTP